MKFLFQLEGWLYNSHPPRIGSPAAPAYDTSEGIAVQSTAIPSVYPPCNILIITV